jgi:hypothetical protein
VLTKASCLLDEKQVRRISAILTNADMILNLLIDSKDLIDFVDDRRSVEHPSIRGEQGVQADA